MLWVWKVAVADMATNQINVAWNFDQRKGKTAKLLWLSGSKGQSCQGSAEGDSVRVGLLQQDARPHPSHRLRPQGLIRTLIYQKIPKGSPFGIFYDLGYALSGGFYSKQRSRHDSLLKAYVYFETSTSESSWFWADNMYNKLIKSRDKTWLIV